MSEWRKYEAFERAANALVSIAAELKRANDAKDEVHPDDMCGMSNAWSLPVKFESSQLAHCERRFGHVKNFHRGGGKQWEANP